MSFNAPWELLFANLLYLPLFLVWITGIIYAIGNWKKHPKVSKLTVIGLILFMLMASFHNFMTPLIIRVFGSSQVGSFLVVQQIISIALHTIMWIFILVAIFCERESPEREEIFPV